MRGSYARGLDPSQAAGLSIRPTAMLPRVFPHLTPADPLYGNLAELPVGPERGREGRDDSAACVEAILAKCHPRHRLVLRTVYLSGLNHVEAAERLGLSGSRLRYAVFLALKRARKAVKG